MVKDISLTPELILERIKERGSKLKCPVCGSNELAVAPAFSNIMLQDRLDGSISINGPTIPAVYTVCNKCGAMTPHSMGVLGFLSGE